VEEKNRSKHASDIFIAVKRCISGLSKLSIKYSPNGTTQSAVTIHMGDTLSMLNSCSSSITETGTVVSEWQSVGVLRKLAWLYSWKCNADAHVYALPRR